MEIIAKIHTDFPEKFGIPRQSGLALGTVGVIEFVDKYRDVSAVRGLEGYSHIWLLWQFSENLNSNWSPTVRPPRLGGNKRMGVFATRSPFRPNPIGLSCVKLIKVDIKCKNAPVLYVEGADILDGTPIYDIKPYLPHTDCVSDATGGFSTDVLDNNLNVVIPDCISFDKKAQLCEILSQDPRPSYHNDERLYTMSFAQSEIFFYVKDKTLYVTKIEPWKK